MVRIKLCVKNDVNCSKTNFPEIMKALGEDDFIKYELIKMLSICHFVSFMIRLVYMKFI